MIISPEISTFAEICAVPSSVSQYPKVLLRRAHGTTQLRKRRPIPSPQPHSDPGPPTRCFTAPLREPSTIPLFPTARPHRDLSPTPKSDIDTNSRQHHRPHVPTQPKQPSLLHPQTPLVARCVHAPNFCPVPFDACRKSRQCPCPQDTPSTESLWLE